MIVDMLVCLLGKGRESVWIISDRHTDSEVSTKPEICRYHTRTLSAGPGGLSLGQPPEEVRPQQSLLHQVCDVGSPGQILDFSSIHPFSSGYRLQWPRGLGWWPGHVASLSQGDRQLLQLTSTPTESTVKLTPRMACFWPLRGSWRDPTLWIWAQDLLAVGRDTVLPLILFSNVKSHKCHPADSDTDVSI